MIVAQSTGGGPSSGNEYVLWGERIEHDLDEARDLVATGHPEMGLVRAVASFDWFMKRAFLEPYLQTVTGRMNSDLAKLILSQLRRPNGWAREVPQLLGAFWNIDTATIPAWADFLAFWTLRNEIMHNGARCTRAHAERGVHTCEVVVKTLLVKRIDARSVPTARIEDV
jgi:hypothetical protein